VAVNSNHRGAGIAGRMLDHLTKRHLQEPLAVTHLETSITPDNRPSQRLFTAFANRWGATVERRILFDASLFPGGHLAEELYRIGPIDDRKGRLPRSL
jgi:L-2,4-diaminobutyric acid acetyltransferase